MVANLLASIAFYTTFPIPASWRLDFHKVARLAPFVGLIVGGVLGLLDFSLNGLGVPPLTRSALVVVSWIAITGGLHLDGAMDAADGLAVTQPERRLEVMADSATGAFGAIAAGAILLLKLAALTELESDRLLCLMAVAGWGRWGQMLAILRYPYLKPTGKGAFHKQAIQTYWDLLPSTILLLGLGGVLFVLVPQHGSLAVATIAGGSAIATWAGIWFNRKLGGHTGDTYGAVVEWTEALLLCFLTIFNSP